MRLVDPHPHEEALAGAAVLDPERRLRHGGECFGVLLSPRVEAASRAWRFEGRDKQRPLPDVYELSGHGGSLTGGYDCLRGIAVPSLVMDLKTLTDTPVLNPLARALAETDRLQAFAVAPDHARVSEALLPLFLAAVWTARDGALVCVLPDDADARDTAEAAGWFLGEDRVGLLASRGVRWETGLRPPPHLVGERARALEILAAGGLVCASALGVADLLPPPRSRPETMHVQVGSEPGSEELVAELALAGYERVERVEERGQFAVRGGIVDVFPSTGREPIRIELFGDEVESIRAFSAFTQRALRVLEEATIHPAAERRLDLSDPELRARDEAGFRTTLSRRSDHPIWCGSRTRFARPGRRSSSTASRSRGWST